MENSVWSVIFNTLIKDLGDNITSLTKASSQKKMKRSNNEEEKSMAYSGPDQSAK